MKIEILTSEQCSYHYYSETLGPNYISFGCYEQKSGLFPHKYGYHIQSSDSLLWDSAIHIFVVSI